MKEKYSHERGELLFAQIAKELNTIFPERSEETFRQICCALELLESKLPGLWAAQAQEFRQKFGNHVLPHLFDIQTMPEGAKPYFLEDGTLSDAVISVINNDGEKDEH